MRHTGQRWRLARASFATAAPGLNDCHCLMLRLRQIIRGDEIDLQLVDWRPAYGQAARHRRRSADRVR